MLGVSFQAAQPAKNARWATAHDYRINRSLDKKFSVSPRGRGAAGTLWLTLLELGFGTPLGLGHVASTTSARS